MAQCQRVQREWEFWPLVARRRAAAGGRRRRFPGWEPLESRCMLSNIGIPISTIPTADSGPTGITTGPDGNIWFTEANIGEIGRISYNATTHQILAVDPPITPANGSQPFAITVGPDENLWFTDQGTNSIGTINVHTDAVTEYPIPTPDSMPWGITSGPNDTIWFTEENTNKIGMIDLNAPTITVSEPITLSSVARPFFITEGADSNLYFTEKGTSQIGRIVYNATTDASSLTEYPTPTSDSEPYGITAGPGGSSTLWYTEFGANKVGMINISTSTPSFAPEITIPTGNSGPEGITAGPDGEIYFIENNFASGVYIHNLGIVSPTSNTVIAEIPIPTSGSAPTSITPPQAITVGPDDNLWLTDSNPNGGAIDLATDAQLVVAHPSSTKSGSSFGLTVTDRFLTTGAVNTNYNGSTGSVFVTIGGPSGPIHLVMLANNGQASFGPLFLNQAGSYVITASASVAPGSTGGPAPAGPSAIIVNPALLPKVVSEQITPERKLNKHHKPVGKPLGFLITFDFNTVMSASAANPANYQVDALVTKRVRRKTVTSLHPVNFHVSYRSFTELASLTVRCSQTFKKGGRVTLIASALTGNGISSAAGVLLDGSDLGTPGNNGIFTISPGGRGISQGPRDKNVSRGPTTKMG